VPVYNVAMPLLRHLFPEQPPFRILEIPLASEDVECFSSPSVTGVASTKAVSS
jgi:hypothetical protein